MQNTCRWKAKTRDSKTIRRNQANTMLSCVFEQKNTDPLTLTWTLIQMCGKSRSQNSGGIEMPIREEWETYDTWSRLVVYR